MKPIKSTFSIILSIFMMFNLLSVFASAEKRTISWEDFRDNLVYSGELNTGANTFHGTGEFIFNFTADREGVYVINFSVDEAGDEYGYSSSISENIIGGNPVGAKYSVEADELGSVYYFENGEEQFYGLITEGDISTYSVDIQYLGKVKNFELAATDLQVGFDIDTYEDESNTICEIHAPVSVTTEEKSEFTISGLTFSFDKLNLESGDYTADVSVFNCKKEISFSVYHAHDFVTSVKPNEKYVAPAVTLNENGEIEFYSNEEYSFAVDFELADGTVISNNCENLSFEFTLEDGKVVRYMSDIIKGEDGKYYWAIIDEDDSIIISEAVIEKNENPDNPTDDNIFVTIFKWIVKFIKSVISFVKSFDSFCGIF